MHTHSLHVDSSGEENIDHTRLSPPPPETILLRMSLAGDHYHLPHSTTTTMPPTRDDNDSQNNNDNNNGTSPPVFEDSFCIELKNILRADGGKRAAQTKNGHDITLGK